MTSAAARSDVRPVENPALDRFASAVVTAVPPILLVLGVVFGWGGLLHWQDLLVFIVTYLLFGFGVTVGFHRLLTHGSFKTHRWVRLTAAVLGSAAVEGPVIEWVATHRKHHRFSDEEGDPHSPHVGHGSGFTGALRGLFYAHIGWVFRDAEVADENRYAKDLMADPAMRFVDRTFVLWVPGGPGRSLRPWDGADRLGDRRPDGDALGRRGADLRPPPRHLQRQQPLPLLRTPALSRPAIDSRNLRLARPWRPWASRGTTTTTPSRPRRAMVCGAGSSTGSAAVIWALEKLGLAWDVVRISPARMAGKATV